LRNIWRNKVFSFINVFGLALGLACSLLIILWVSDELRYDQFHARGAGLYQVMENQAWSGIEINSTQATPGTLAPALKAEIPEVELAAKVTWEQEDLLTVGDKANKEKGHYASPDFFRMFSFPLVQGNPATAIASPTAIVISQNLARKYFGTEEAAMGKTIRVNNKDNFLVTGIMRDVPENSSLKFDYVLPEEYFEKENQWLKEWGNNGIQTFALLRKGTSAEKVSAKIKRMVQQHDSTTTNIELFLHPYTDRYLYSNFENGVVDGGRIEYVHMFSLVAVFILVIACINFMNLATARSAKRAKEVGVRKVVGAGQRLLVGQFIGEAVLIALMAMGLAAGIVLSLLPTFNSLTEKKIALSLGDPAVGLTLLGLTVFTGLLSGSYPALFLSSLQPVRVLKGTLKFSSGAVLFRKGLVVFQFAMSILLIVGTVVVFRQVQYIKSKNLGLDRENLVYLPLEGDLRKSFEPFKQELLAAPGIKTVSMASGNAMAVGSSTIGVKWKGKDPNDKILFSQMAVGYDFLEAMGIELKEGRTFSKAFTTDTSNYIINEEAARRIGLNPIVGQDLNFWGKDGKIVGVMKNFHTQSLHAPIDPLIIRLRPQEAYMVLVRAEAGKTTQALSSLERVARKYNPAYPFEYDFADQEFERQYKSETVIGELAKYFAFLAIFISCLGLFGLSAFTAEQRTKEMGIRKVLGASVTSIVTLLSKDFLKLVALAFVIAAPLAWYAVNQWLRNFEYKVPVGWTTFALAGGLALLIALLTVSFQSIKAALTNPVKSLRSE
jgi:predicted permease